MKYIKGTYKLGIEYKYGGDSTLVGYIDYDYAGDIDDRKSTSGYIFHLELGLISGSKKSNQQCHCHLQKMNILVHQKHLKKLNG